jgi:hypothetical protein
MDPIHTHISLLGFEDGKGRNELDVGEGGKKTKKRRGAYKVRKNYGISEKKIGVHGI